MYQYIKLYLFVIIVFGAMAGKAQLVCSPLPQPGSSLKVNTNNYLAFNLNCSIPGEKDNKNDLLDHNTNQLATWSINGKEVRPSQPTQLGTIYFSSEKLLLYKAPAKKPANSNITLTAEFISGKKNIYVWTISIIDEANTEVYFEDADEIMKIKTDGENRIDVNAMVSKYNKQLTPEAKAKINEAKAKGLIDAGKHNSNARAQFINDGNNKHFVITVSDLQNPAAGTLVFELPDTLLRSYQTNGSECKAAMSFGVTNCGVQVQTKGYAHEISDQGKMREGLLTITLTEVGKPGGYVKGTFMGTMATYSKNCGGRPNDGGHRHPIELREVYGSFVAVRQINIIKKN